MLALDLLAALRRAPHLLEHLLEVAHLALHVAHLLLGALALGAHRAQRRLEALALGADGVQLAHLPLEVGVGGGEGGVPLGDARQLRLQVLALRGLELERVLQLLARRLLLPVLQEGDSTEEFQLRFLLGKRLEF